MVDGGFGILCELLFWLFMCGVCGGGGFELVYGLGLYIVCCVMDLYGGSVELWCIGLFGIVMCLILL